MAERVLANQIYKCLLENDDAFTHLQHFVRQAEEFHAKDSDYDVVKEYLQLSRNCHELGQYVKELATCDCGHAMALLNAMCHILIRLASDLPVFISAGTSIVNEMLSHGMKTIFNFLKLKQKSSRTKSALHLLTAMIALGNQTAHQVVTKLNFSNSQYLHLLKRTNFSEDEDVRSAFLNLIVLVITICNNNIIRQIMEVKGFLNSIFPGLISDRVSTITLILNTFRQFLVENTNIPKTTKLHLFNDYSLKPVIQLYTWKGPVRVKKHGKRKLGEEIYSTAYEVSDEELDEVRFCVHEFMLALCCSHKNGIIFSDLSCGVSGRNYNTVITNILKLFDKPYMDPLMSSFVISVLQACPDQLKHYLNNFGDSFTPRLSSSWLNVVDFLEKILKSQNLVAILFKTDAKRSATVLVSIAKTFCLLDVLIAVDISEVFNSGHRVLCYHLSRFLLNILNQIEDVIKFCDCPDSANIPYDASELDEFKLLFLSLMFPCLPGVDKFQKYWHKMANEKSEIMQDESLKDLQIPTFSEELTTLTEVIKFYKTFSSTLNREFHFDLPQMLNDLKVCSSVLPSCDLGKVYSSIIDFCSEENSISLWNKIFFGTKVFEGCQWEQETKLTKNQLIDIDEVIKAEKSDDISENSLQEKTEVLYIPHDKKHFSYFAAAAFQTLQSLPEDKTKDTVLLLLQHKSSKDLTILGTLIGQNDKFRKVTQTFISDKFEDSDITEYLYLVSKCLCNCSEDEQDSNFKDSIASNFCSSFQDIVFVDISADLDTLQECGIGKAMQLLFCQKYSNLKKLQEFCKLILRDPENKIPSRSKMLIILEVFESWKFFSHETDKIKLQLLKVCCLWLSSGLNLNLSCPELFNFLKELLQSMNNFEISKVVDLTDFFSNCLKFALKCDDIGKDLIKILSLLLEKSEKNNLPVQSLHGLLTGHSQFFRIMLSDEEENNNLKENLIDLLIVLTKMDPLVCKENHIGLLLSAYGATMASIDQKLLYLMKIYGDNDINMSQYSPFLWGKSAIYHYSIMKSSQSFLWKQPKLQDILSLLLPDKIKNTLLYFPQHMKLEPTLELVKVEEEMATQVYDMRFFLPLFAHLLSPGAFVHCSQFIQSKSPQLIFISLSSMEPPVRALSLYCLSQFYQHLEGAYFKEKGIWLCLLDSLRNSIVSNNPKIPNIVSLFLARATDIFTKPEHKLYRPLYTFILRKPLLDIGQVPEFYNLFNSSYIEHRILRLWLLNLLADGLRSSLDFHICEKRYIFSSLLTHYFSCVSTNQEKIAILQTLNSAVKIKSSVHTLCEKGLLIWLQKVVEESDLSEAKITTALCEIMKSLEDNVPHYPKFIHVLKKLIPK